MPEGIIAHHGKIKIDEKAFIDITREEEVARFNISVNYSLDSEELKVQEQL